MGSPDRFLALVRRAFQFQTAPSGKVFRSLRGATKGAALGNQPFGHVGFASPLKRVDGNFTGLLGRPPIKIPFAHSDKM